jgi:hypothetical protein
MELTHQAHSQPRLRKITDALECQDRDMEELMVELGILIERIDRIANSMDASNYPKNIPSPQPEDKSDCDILVNENKSAGIILEFEIAIERRRRILFAIQNKIIPLMSEGIRYLESHI